MSSEGVTFVGCRVVHLETARLRYPATLDRPVFLIETLEGCDELLLTSLRIGNGDNQLAVDAVPAALFEQPPAGPLYLPALVPGVELVLEFANPAAAPASFLVWLGTRTGIARKYAELLNQKGAAR